MDNKCSFCEEEVANGGIVSADKSVCGDCLQEAEVTK